MKNGLFTALALLTLPSLTAQVLPPTSVPVNKTKTSLLTKQADQLAQHDLQANFRLFLNYSAKSDFIVKFGDHPVEVPAGEKVTADFTFEHLPNSSALIHLSASGDPTTKRIEVPGTIASDGNMAFKPLPGKDFPMDKAFTLMAPFQHNHHQRNSRIPCSRQGKVGTRRKNSLHSGWPVELRCRLGGHA